MKTANVKDLKIELNNRSSKELIDLCLRLSKFKKENKELLTYLLYESSNEAYYIESIKREIDFEFTQINMNSMHYIKKSVRRILRMVKKYIRYSNYKETEIDLLIYYCQVLKKMMIGLNKNTILQNIYDRQIFTIKKALKSLHEDLQYDYQIELDKLFNIDS